MMEDPASDCRVFLSPPVPARLSGARVAASAGGGARPTGAPRRGAACLEPGRCDMVDSNRDRAGIEPSGVWSAMNLANYLTLLRLIVIIHFNNYLKVFLVVS